MAWRRELSRAALLAAMLLLLIPAAAIAGPRWLGAETLEPAATPAGAPDVATDRDGNSAAVWNRNANEIRAAVRPRGGPWGAGEPLETGIGTGDPLVVARPDGTFVAVWVDGNDQIRWAQRPAGGGWSQPGAIGGAGCCPFLAALEAGADNSVALVWTIDGPTQSSTRLADGAWGDPQPLPSGAGNGLSLAKAPDGSAVVAYPEFCAETSSPCVHATYRPRGGAWSAPELAGGSFDISGVAVAARSDSSYTVVWGERPQPAVLLRGLPVQGPSVRSADRPAGPARAWTGPQTVAEPPGGAAGCPVATYGCIDLAAASDDRLVAIWQQDDGNPDQPDQIAAALRPDADNWDPAETIERVTSSDALPRAVFTGNGIPVAVWRDGSGPGSSIRGAHREAGPGWLPVGLSGIATQDITIDFRSVARDGEGNAVTGWQDEQGVSAAGFDGAGPRFSAFSLPGGNAGDLLPFSAAADDNWSALASIEWLFGDGTGAPGATTSHAYAAAGGYTATATARDTIGNATQQSGPVTVGAAQTPVPTPTPDPCGTTDKDKDGIKDACDTNDGSTLPVAFKTFNATVVSGDVFVKLPAGAARAAQGAKPPKGFVRLQGAQTIPVGSTLDTAKGRVRLRTASDTRRHVQTADFFRGRFVVRQVRKPRGRAKRRSTKLITDTILTGSSFRRTCGTTTASISQTRRRSRKRVRRLFGDGKGTFRTRGRNAAATVRGTRWSVQDRCDGTLVTVQRGSVSVRDLVRRRTVIVRTGRTYLARRR